MVTHAVYFKKFDIGVLVIITLQMAFVYVCEPKRDGNRKMPGQYNTTSNSNSTVVKIGYTTENPKDYCRRIYLSDPEYYWDVSSVRNAKYIEDYILEDISCRCKKLNGKKEYFRISNFELLSIYAVLHNDIKKILPRLNDIEENYHT